MQASKIRIQNTKFKVHVKTTVKILFLINSSIKQMLALSDMIWIEYKYNSMIMKRSPED